jgi:hypothetical protein
MATTVYTIESKHSTETTTVAINDMKAKIAELDDMQDICLKYLCIYSLDDSTLISSVETPMSEGDWDIFCLESGVIPDGQISDAVDDISLIVAGTVKNTPSLSNTQDDTDVSNISADQDRMARPVPMTVQAALDSQADVVSTLPRDTRPVTAHSATISVGVTTTTTTAVEHITAGEDMYCGEAGKDIDIVPTGVNDYRSEVVSLVGLSDTDVSNISADHDRLARPVPMTVQSALDSQADVVSTLPRDTRPVTVQYVAPSNLDIHTIHDSSATVSVGVATTTAFPPGFGSAQALLHHDEGAAHHLSVLPPKGGETPLDFLLHPQLYVAGHYDVPTDPMGATLATQLVLHCQTAQHHLGHTKHQLFLASSSLNGKCQPATNFSTRGLSSLDNMELYIRLLSTKYLFSCAPELLITSMFSLPRKEKPPWPSFSTATSKGGRVDMGYLLLAMYMLRLAQMSLLLPASAHSDGPEIISLGEIYVLFA